MELNTLKSPKTINGKVQRGRGSSSGKGGHTTGGGHKGQSSRTGYVKAGKLFEGGQNPISKRVPYLKGISNKGTTRGYFTSKVLNTPINLSKIAVALNEGDTVDIDKLIDLKLVKLKSHKSNNIKVLFDKEIDKKLIFVGVSTSQRAKTAIEKAGGKVE
ncbi:MAG: 50S ribosomal protein L15 [Candidatus Dojkabacteria bacterium]|nr:50S ribosomal protein L15 [Candidatus Dojkabacteria bacterium]MDQ7021372.1 50S ribosomal protein L15 [Candidatus Dojkabacteria bacterium]